jgi:hypothetical protein
MISRRFSLLVTSIFLLLISFSSALETNQTQKTLSIDVIPIAPEVEVGGQAQFLVRITHLGEDRDAFKLSGDPADMSPFSDYVQYVTVEPNQIKLDPYQTEEVIVSLKILDHAPANDEFTTHVKIASLSDVGVKIDVPLHVSLVSPKEVIQIAMDAPTEVRPGDALMFDVLFKNRLNFELLDYEISVYSDLPGISDSFYLNFTPKQEFTRDFSFPIDLDAEPGSYALNVKVYGGSDLKGSFVSAFSVLEKSAVGEKSSEKGGFLKSETTLQKSNDGNVRITQEMTVESNFFKNVFTATQPEAATKGGNLVWSFSLEPGETYTVKIIRNYRPFFYGFLVVVIAVALLYFYIEKSVVIRKRVFMMKSTVEGITEMKILLIVRNGGSSSLHGVKIMDVLPNIIHPTYEFGTLKPDQIQQGERSKRFVWNIGTLEPKEERMFTYRVRAKMHLSEGATLPPATLHYEKQGTTIAVTSAHLDVVFSSPKEEQNP